jgi:DNA-binding NarL/FixJ family response regulator
VIPGDHQASKTNGIAHGTEKEPPEAHAPQAGARQPRGEQALETLVALRAQLGALTAAVDRAIITLEQNEEERASPCANRKRPMLSPREQEVLSLLAIGCSYREAAARLNIQVCTVRAHVASACRKLGAPNRLVAVKIYAHAERC